MEISEQQYKEALKIVQQYRKQRDANFPKLICEKKHEFDGFYIVDREFQASVSRKSYDVYVVFPKIGYRFSSTGTVTKKLYTEDIFKFPSLEDCPGKGKDLFFFIIDNVRKLSVISKEIIAELAITYEKQFSWHKYTSYVKGVELTNGYNFEVLYGFVDSFFDYTLQKINPDE